MVRDLIQYMQEEDGSLVNGFCHARKASVSKTNVDTYPFDGSVPQELLDAVCSPQDPINFREKASWSCTNDRQERGEMNEDDVSSNEESSADRDSENDAGEGGRAHRSSLRTRSLIRLKTR